MTESKTILILPAVANATKAADDQPEITCLGGSFSEIQIIFSQNRTLITWNNKPLESFDSIWLSSFWESRAIAYTIKLYLEEHGVHHSWVEPNSSKLSDQIQFQQAGLPLPKTFASGSRNLDTFIDDLEDHLGYPLVVKDNKGSRGCNSKLLCSREELQDYFPKLPKHKRFHFQEFIPNDYDWGVMVVDCKVVSGEKSYHSEADFRNNACNGAREEFIPVENIPQDIQTLAIDASASLDLSWSRADILIDSRTGQPYLLEVNRTPGITKDSSEETGAQEFLKYHILDLPEA